MKKTTLVGILLVLFLIGNVFALELPRVLPERWVTIRGDINSEVSMKVVKKLVELDQTNGDIRIFLSSPGGHINPGLAIIDIIKTMKNDVQIIVSGQTLSMAVYITAVCTKGKRVLTRHSEVFIHKAGYYTWGIHIHEDELSEKDKNEIKRLQKILNKILIDNTKMTERDIEEVNQKTLDAKTAIRLGIIDGIYSGELP